MSETYPVLQDKVALIIGGSSGIGLEIARGYGKRGARIAIAGRSQAKLDQAITILNAEGIHPFCLSMDVTSVSSLEQGLKRLLKEMPQIDIVVCSAGIHLKVPAEETTLEDWKKIMDTNLNGTFYVNTLFGKQMIRQGKGALINIASLGARVALSKTAAYNVSKSGVEMLTKSLAVEWAPYGIRVNAILPGVFKTSLNEKALSDKVRAENILNHTPMKRFGKLPEIVSAAVFLASDDSSFVTGTSVVVDGGFLAYAGF